MKRMGFLKVVFLFLVGAVASQGLSQNRNPLAYGFKTPGCLENWSGPGCTGTKGVIQDNVTGSSVLNVRLAIKAGSADAHLFCQANECCAGNRTFFTTDCNDWCKDLNHVGGYLTSTENVECGGETDTTAYCLCSGSSNIIAKVAFTASSVTADENECAPLTVELQDASGNAQANTTRSVEIWLRAGSDTGSFYSDSSCNNLTTLPNTRPGFVMPQNTASKTVYWKDPDAGEYDVQAVLIGIPWVNTVMEIEP